MRLAGPTCLAGDVIGDYGFDAVPEVGDLLVFGDMAIYTTCKNNTFNGMPLPGIYARKPDGTAREIVMFGYSGWGKKKKNRRNAKGFARFCRAKPFDFSALRTKFIRFFCALC